MEKETKLKLYLFWFGVGISIIGWILSICYVSYLYYSTHDVSQSKAFCMGIILGTMLFGFLWVLVFGSIKFLAIKVHVLFKILLLVYIATVVFLFSNYAFFGFAAAFPLACFCAVQIAMDISDKNIKAYFRDTSTKMALALFLVVTVFTFLLSLFIGITEGNIASRILLSVVFSLIIGFHAWVIYGMILYAKAIHKSLQQS